MLDVSPFVNDQGVVQLFTISVGDAPAEGRDHVGDISFENPILTANLVATFSSAKGQLRASVKIAYQGRPGPSALSDAVEVSKSSDFRAWRIAESADWIAFFVALLVSVLSGIKLYALGATFGSLSDYLALFTWGAGIDQGKNFLQSLGAYSSESSGTPGATTPAAGARAG